MEKIEANSDVGYAIVLLSPDDVGGADGEQLCPRARQNVIFECGYLMAKLGRKRITCLRKGNIEMPSDLHGVARIDITSDIRQATVELRRELLAAGYRPAEI